jgi:hypothetical protein
MKVRNVHERELDASPEEVGALVDSLASPRDALWPRDSWPPMRFDRPLSVGATVGHGPVGYSVAAYVRGKSIRFRFHRPRGFEGTHGYEVVAGSSGRTVLRHTLEMTTTGSAQLSWPLAFRPLHDGLLEDSMARAEAAVGIPPTVRRWSPWIRFLRWAMTGGRARGQITPEGSGDTPRRPVDAHPDGGSPGQRGDD